MLIESITKSPAVPIQQLKNDMQGPSVSKGDYAFSSNLFEVGLETQYFTFSYNERLEFYTQFTNDTARIIQQEKNNVNYAQGESFKIDLDAFHVRTKGVKLSLPIYNSNQFGATLAGAYYQANEMHDGKLYGDVITDDQEITGNIHLDYSYSEDIFFGRDASEVTGYGYGVDVKGWLKISDSTRLEFLARDLLSSIRWNNQQYTTGNATTNTVALDDNGLIVARPAAEWLESNQYVSQSFPRHTKIKILQQLNNPWSMGLELSRYDKQSFLTIEGVYQIGSQQCIAGLVDITSGSVGFRYSHPRITLAISSDHYSWEKVHNFSLLLSGHWPLTY